MLRLRGLLEVLPHNKIVEEVHHGLKQDAKNTQKSQRDSARQQAVGHLNAGLVHEGHPSLGPRDKGLVDPTLQLHKGHRMQEQTLLCPS